MATGAFGAHGLKNILDSENLTIWHTADYYQMIHALALILLGIFEVLKKENFPKTRAAFAVGIVLFSGSLYALALTKIRTLGMITPFGGLSFLGAWISFGVLAYRRR